MSHTPHQFERVVRDMEADKHKWFVLNSANACCTDDGRNVRVIITTVNCLKAMSVLKRTTAVDGTYKIVLYQQPLLFSDLL